MESNKKNRQVIITVPHAGEYTYIDVLGDVVSVPLQSGKCSPDGNLREGVWVSDVVSLIFPDEYNNRLHILDRNDMEVSPEYRKKSVNILAKHFGPENCLLIEPHLNAAGNSGWHNAKGHNVRYNGKFESKIAATSLNDVLEKENPFKTKPRNGGVILNKHLTMMGVSCAAILCELFFMDNKEYAKKAWRYTNEYAVILRNFVERWLND